jgi:hypothetical protein
MIIYPASNSISTTRIRILADRVVTWSSRWRAEGLAQSSSKPRAIRMLIPASPSPPTLRTSWPQPSRSNFRALLEGGPPPAAPSSEPPSRYQKRERMKTGQASRSYETDGLPVVGYRSKRTTEWAVACSAAPRASPMSKSRQLVRTPPATPRHA